MLCIKMSLKKVDFKVQSAISKTHLPSLRSTSNLYGPGTRPVYNSEPKLGYGPGPIYESKPKIGSKSGFLRVKTSG